MVNDRSDFLRIITTILCFSFLLVSLSCDNKIPEKQISTKQSKKALVVDQDYSGKTLLLVHSYHPEYPWVASITEGVRSKIEGSGLVLEIFYMDTKRKTEASWKEESGILAAKEVEKLNPVAVITADDNAQEYFGKKFVDADFPIVFCGVNADPSKYGYPASNITGIIERPHFEGTAEFAKSILPIKKIAIVSSNDPTSVGAVSFMKEEDLSIEIVDFKLISDFDIWKKTVLEYNNTVDALGVYMYHTVKQAGNENSMDPKDVMNWTVENISIPTLGFFKFGIEDGLMLGEVESGQEHGEKAADYVLRILDGEPIESLPIRKANIGIKMINKKTTSKLEIAIDDKILSKVDIID